MKKENKNKQFESLLEHIENIISNYDKELKHTVNNELEYVFKDDEYVGDGNIIFNNEAFEIITKNKYEYELFVKSLDIKFTNIVIIESTPTKLHYKLKNIDNTEVLQCDDFKIVYRRKEC